MLDTKHPERYNNALLQLKSFRVLVIPKNDTVRAYNFDNTQVIEKRYIEEITKSDFTFLVIDQIMVRELWARADTFVVGSTIQLAPSTYRILD
ncbi:MAG: hypothetical protein H6607_02880 [Flavobacteriales bacterium]|nr:hypothetical protein [Flavobacteriales bacterium]